MTVLLLSVRHFNKNTKTIVVFDFCIGNDKLSRYFQYIIIGNQ